MINTPSKIPPTDARNRPQSPLVLRYTASIALVLLQLAGLGCSSTLVESHAANIPLHLTQHEDAVQCSQVYREGSPAYVYRCRRGGYDLYVSQLQACHRPDKYTYQATTRQLLVGFADLQILRQSPVTLGDRSTLRSIVHATLDATPVLTATFTYREKSCINDLVVWRLAPRTRPSEDEIAEFEHTANEIAVAFSATTPQREVE